MKYFKDYLMSIIDSNYAQVFVIIKPGFFKYAPQILRRFAEDGWELEKQITKQLLLKEAHRLYKIHKKEEWYEDLCKYMSEEPTTAWILVNKNKPMNDNVFKEIDDIKKEIRDKWAKSEMLNVIHSSDSMEHMAVEKSVYFAS